ncbi:MAG: hypothetical protein AAGD10_08630 [Myxococcota bacterium]
MKQLALTLTLLFASSVGLTACGGGCDTLADCNDALREAGFTTLIEITGNDDFCDAQLDAYRDARASIEAAIQTFPSECE